MAQISVEFSGNNKTKSTYLERFITSAKKKTIDTASLNEDVRRLKSLSSVLDAQYEIDTTDGNQHIRYRITERGTLLPVGDFGITNESYWFGAGAMEANLAGRGIYLYGFYRYYDRHSFHGIFRIPYLAGSKWGVGLILQKWATNEAIFKNELTAQYEYDYINIEATGSYELAFEHELEFGGGLLYEKYNLLEADDAYWPETHNRTKAVLKVRHKKRKLRHHYFYLDGWTNEAGIESVHSIDGYEDIYFLFYDKFCIYKRVTPKINLAIRSIFGLSTNNESPFSPFVVDSYMNIRGVGNRVDRGTGTLVLNLEYRQTIYENHIGGIQGVIFSDLGTWRKVGGLIDDITNSENIKTYGGLGVRFIYKKAYSAILSIDYGANLQNMKQGGWVVGIGQYF